MRYLITGTAGFIGFHLARRLLEEGHSVTGFDGMTAYYDVKLKEQRHAILGKYDAFLPVIADLLDVDALNRTAVEEPEIIVHLAAQAGVRYSLENPKAYVDANLIGTWNVLELAKRVQPKHLLLASTSSIYGANAKIPFAESDHADEPLTLYAATKKSMEVIAHSYAHLYAIPTTAFRFFTVYGPWGRPDMALFKFTHAILNDQPLDIYGHGQMSRDFTYIDDLIEAVVRLSHVIPAQGNRIDAPSVIDTLSPIAPFRIVNIGGGQPVELMRFVEEVERAVGRPAIRRMLPMQQGDVPRTFASPDLLKALIDFVPHTSVEAGIQAFVDWYLEYYADARAPGALVEIAP